MAIVTIEKLLHWAFVEQMPTPESGALMNVGDFGPWSAIIKAGVLGAKEQKSPRADRGPSWIILEPDPDAVIVVNRVAALDDVVVTEHDGYDLLAGWPELGELGQEAVAKAWGVVSTISDGVRVLRSPLSLLVRRVVVMGVWPKWDCDEPSIGIAHLRGKPALFRKVKQAVEWSSDGTPTRWVEIEMDGFNKISQRPYPGSYRKHVLTPDISGALASRIEYTLTHAAMTMLANELDGLGGRKVLPPMRSPMPWAARKDLQIGA